MFINQDDINKALWSACDTFRGTISPDTYKDFILTMLFLKYISDAFEEKYEELKQDALSDPEDRDEYTAVNIFWVAKEARWTFIKENAKSPKIGQIIDEAMVAIEKDNANLILSNYFTANLRRPDL